MTWKRLRLNVGHEKKLELEAGLKEPAHPNAVIIFTPGISRTYEDYVQHLLDPLAEEASVLAYNLRGHGTSDGRFDPPALTGDLEDIVDLLSQPVVLLGHSIGAGIAAAAAKTRADARGAYLLSPYFDSEFLAGRPRKYVALARILTYTGIPFLTDPLVRLCNKGFHNRAPIRDFGRLLKAVRPESVAKPVAWIVSDRDEMLGTLDNDMHYRRIQNVLRELYPDYGRDRSALAKGLNHCLNVTTGSMSPFLHEPSTQVRDRIVTDIIEFSRACMVA